MKKENDALIRFLYGTVIGRGLLKLILKLHVDRLIVRFLRSPRSCGFTAWYVKRNHIPISREELQQYATFRDFFARDREPRGVDITPEHMISPCDGWLSVYPIAESSSFAIKHSRYYIRDLIGDEKLAKNYHGGELAWSFASAPLTIITTITLTAAFRAKRTTSKGSSTVCSPLPVTPIRSILSIGAAGVCWLQRISGPCSRRRSAR